MVGAERETLITGFARNGLDKKVPARFGGERAVRRSSMAEKWDRYFAEAEQSGVPPPWESASVFSQLPRIVQENMLAGSSTAIELGCGASATAVWLAANGFDVTAVDISELALSRARRFYPTSKVQWQLADIMDESFALQHAGKYDLVFDMQCFHCLRDIDETAAAEVIKKLLSPRGTAVVVCGAEVEGEQARGPPRVARDDFLRPFASKLSVVSCELGRFNPTACYGDEGPASCWIAVVRGMRD